VPAQDHSLSLRSFDGPEAHELSVLCQSGSGPDDPAPQAAATYRALGETLSAHGASAAEIVSETLFVRDVHDLPAILAARARILGESRAQGSAPLPSFIEQPPADGAAFAVLANLVVPHERGAWSVRDVRAETGCTCEGCAGSGARVVRLGEQTSLHSSNLYGSGSDAYAQTLHAFRNGQRLLEQCGLDFRDVVRAWLQLRDIDRDYDALNAARRDFFADSGIALRPASTGVGGAPCASQHLVSLTLHAVRRATPLDVTRMSTPLLNEAWSYGADFSRGLRVVEANKITLHVSGTASIDDAGNTVHVGDFAAQAARMLDNIDSLLAGHGATRDDLASGVTYLKHARDAATLHELDRQRGFDRFPCAVVQADLCRPELLCETEVVAVLPPGRARA
jgi:enamine deaminase RidA (YjgF/YER057c/UK114 family)